MTMRVPYQNQRQHSISKQKESRPKTQNQKYIYFIKKREKFPKNKLVSEIKHSWKRTSIAAESALYSKASGAAMILEVEIREGLFDTFTKENESCGLEEMVGELHTGKIIVERDDEIDAIFDFKFVRSGFATRGVKLLCKLALPYPKA